VIARCTGTQGRPDQTNVPAAVTGPAAIVLPVPNSDRPTIEPPAVPTLGTDSLPSLPHMREIFRATCRQHIQSIFARADLCHLIKSSYPRDEQLQIIDGILDRPRFDKLAKIAADQRLRPKEPILPPSETTIISLSNFTDAELAAAFQAGIIHPAATRRALLEWRSAQRSHTAHRDADGMKVYAVIWRTQNPTPETIARLKELVREARQLVGVEIVFRH
jgi:hypothetical protein